ncbi:MAG: hypothetical protein U0T84_06385 [Chitinophagales bacterium]
MSSEQTKLTDTVRKWRLFFNDSKEIIIAIASVLSIAVAFLTKELIGNPSLFINHYLVGIEFLNIIVLLWGIIAISTQKDLVITSEFNYGELEALETTTEDKKLKRVNIDDRVERVNKLVQQFREAIRGFAVVVLLLYVVLMVIDYGRTTRIPHAIADYSGHITMSPNVDSVNQIAIEKDFIESQNFTELAFKATNLNSIKKLINDFVDNAFNLYSSGFIYIAFTVLFTVTLEEKTLKSRINYWLPISLASTICLFHLLIIINGFMGLNLEKLTILVRILSGLFAAAGFMLLFSRFISMEWFFGKGEQIQKYFYYIGSIVIFPLYAVVQPLYGLFDIEASSINSSVFKAIVLTTCLVGKIFLVLFVSTIIDKKWLHSYLYFLLQNTNAMSNISKGIYSLVGKDSNRNPAPARNGERPVPPTFDARS